LRELRHPLFSPNHRHLITCTGNWRTPSLRRGGAVRNAFASWREQVELWFTKVKRNCSRPIFSHQIFCTQPAPPSPRISSLGTVYRAGQRPSMRFTGFERCAGSYNDAHLKLMTWAARIKVSCRPRW
jgi:hypothetical protein